MLLASTNYIMIFKQMAILKHVRVKYESCNIRNSASMEGKCRSSSTVKHKLSLGILILLNANKACSLIFRHFFGDFGSGCPTSHVNP